MKSGANRDAEEINAILKEALKLAAEGNDISEEEIITKISFILAKSESKPLKLSEPILMTYQDNQLKFSPLFWVGALKLKLVAEKLLQAQKKGELDLNFSAFDNECELYADEFLSKEFIERVKNVKKTQGSKEEVDEFDEVEDLIDEFTDEFTDEDAFEVIETPSAEDEYNQYKNWTIHSGFNPAIYQTLMSQLAKRGESFFALNNVYSVTIPNLPSSRLTPLTLRTNDDKKNILYFMPCRVDFRTDINEEFDPKENPSLETYLKYINECCPHLDKPTRFVVPLSETPHPKGYSHSILMCLDYDPQTKTLTPVIYDSLTRGIVNNLGKYLTWKQHRTCDTLLKSAFSKIVPSTQALTVKPLVRYAYGHQNRVSEGNCGSYTFRLAHMATDEFDTMDTFDELYKHIPTPNGWVTANNFLTQDHVEEITQVVRANKSVDLASLQQLSKMTSSPVNESRALVENLVKGLFIGESQLNKIEQSLFENLNENLKQRGETTDKYQELLLNASTMDNKEYNTYRQHLAKELGDHPVLYTMQVLRELKNLKTVRNEIIAEIMDQYQKQKFPVPFKEVLFEKKYLEYQQACNNLSSVLIEAEMELPVNILGDYKTTLMKHPAIEKYNLASQEFIVKYPLHFAISSNHKTLPLITNINAKMDGKTALYFAVEQGKLEVAKELYKLGAEVDTAGPQNDSAFVAAARLKQTEIVCAMLKVRGSSWISSGMKRKQQDRDGRTAFHYLAANGDIKAIKKFIESIKGVTVSYSEFTDILDKHNESALHILARTGNVEILKTLESFSTWRASYTIENTFFPKSITQPNDEGRTPIDIAAQHGHAEMVDFLAKRMGLSKEETTIYHKKCNEARKRTLSSYSLSKSKELGELTHTPTKTVLSPQSKDRKRPD